MLPLDQGFGVEVNSDSIPISHFATTPNLYGKENVNLFRSERCRTRLLKKTGSELEECGVFKSQERRTESPAQ
jgi:hypothetical protein